MIRSEACHRQTRSERYWGCAYERSCGLTYVLLAAATCSLLLFGGCSAEDPANSHGDGTHQDQSDGQWSAASNSGRYVVEIDRIDPRARYADLHAWRIRILDNNGDMAETGAVGFDGGMPSHGHGFETRPIVTGRAGDGSYTVEGVRFHMPGAWALRVEFVASEGIDGADFAIDVPY